ncbi:uncharacterized protein NPIL_148501 [Nephila pilipes]|uniref:ALMS motif domain-containing protein n=1 Tax=Nephila pilipes TaxID=299642 RepID=A0A8X6NP45_NEPPI|nr:uncharacterized protein NPIL_148501 [Nephila pilipes]
MGGEVDNSQTSTTNVVTKQDSHSDLLNSFLDDEFVDDLTLKVRSLLKSWEDSPVENDSNNVLLDNQIEIRSNQLLSNNIRESETKKSTVSDCNSNKIMQESQCSSELKCICNNKAKFNYIKNVSSDHSYTDSSFDIKSQLSETKPSIGLKKNIVDNSSESSTLKDVMLQNISDHNVNKYPHIPKISVSKTDQYEVKLNSKQPYAMSSTQSQSVDDPLSYYEFTNKLQNAVRRTDSENGLSECISNEHAVLVSTAKSYGMEKSLTSKKHITSSHLLPSAAISTDMFSRDFSDKEAERSWSEITVVAESLSEPKSTLLMMSKDNIHDSINLQSTCPVSHKKCPNVQVKENLASSLRNSSAGNDTYSSNRRDMRLGGIDPYRAFQELDKEFNSSNYRPNSSLSDHDTPPLSASSMASSKRLEWDNGADIGYSIVALNPKTRSGTIIPSMARSEPEGISFINEATTSTGTSQITFQGFVSVNSSEASTSLTYSHLDSVNSKDSSVHDPGMEDLLERSSSLGSLSRSDSKKSVIYNSVRDMRQCKIQRPNFTSVINFCPSQKNSSWPDLSMKNSQRSCDWSAVSLTNLLSKSDELIGSKKNPQSKHLMNKFHFPGFSSSDNINNKSSDSFQLPERIMPLGENIPLVVQSVPEHISAENMSHSCKSCHSPLNVNINSTVNLTVQKSDDLLKLQEGDLESFEFDSETLNSNQITNTSQCSHHFTESDWLDDINADIDSNLHYVTDIPEFPDYQMQTFHSRPLLLLSNDSSKLKGNNISNIMHSFFGNSSTNDHSVSGNLEVKPHIRWYPFTSVSHLQDIKNVSTQTSMSFISKDQLDSSVQVCDQQVLSKSSGLNLGSNSLERKTFVDENYKITGFPNANSRLTNVSSISTKATSMLEHDCATQLDKRTDSFSSYSNPVTLNSKLFVNKDNHLNTVNNELNNPNLVNGPEINTWNVSFEDKTGKNEEKLFLSTETSTFSNKAEISQYSYGYDWHTPTSSSKTLNSQESIYSSVKKMVDQESNYASNQLVSSMERRVGVGQSQFSPESLESKNSSTNLGKSHGGEQSKQISFTQSARKSSSASLNDSIRKNLSQSASFSNAVYSRTTALNQVENDSANYFHEGNKLKLDSNETLPMTLNYRQNAYEMVSSKYNAYTTENQITDYERANHDSSSVKSDHIDITSEIAKSSPTTESNSSELLLQNHPSLFSHHYKGRMIPKSYSDPLITAENLDTGLRLGIDRSGIDRSGLYHQKLLANKTLDINLYDLNHRMNSNEEYMYEGKSLGTEEKLKLYESLNSNRYEKNVFEKVTPSAVFCEGNSIHNRKQFSEASVLQDNSHLSSMLDHTDYTSKYFLKDQDHLHIADKIANPSDPFKLSKYCEVAGDMQILKSSSQRKRNFDLKEKIQKSVGIQVPECIHGSQKCSFCHKSKNSHMNFCYQKEAFKTVLNHTLARKIKASTYGTSFCVFSSECYCCCNKSLQEAFNFHRPEIVDRIETRKKEIGGRSKEKLFVHMPCGSHTTPKPPTFQLKLKPITDVSEKAKKVSSYKENNKRSKRNAPLSEKNKAFQKARQKNLNKYNRMMSKIYSQRLKSETLEGRVNHQRNEILIKS